MEQGTCAYCGGGGTVRYHERNETGGGGRNYDAPCPSCTNDEDMPALLEPATRARRERAPKRAGR